MARNHNTMERNHNTMERSHNTMEENLTNVSSIENVFFLSYNTTGFNEQRGEIINDIHNNLGIQNCFTAVQEH